MGQLLDEGWTMPFKKKFQYPEDIQFEIGCLVYATATELGIVEYDSLWKPIVTRFKREKIITVKAFNKVSDDKLLHMWHFQK